MCAAPSPKSKGQKQQQKKMPAMKKNSKPALKSKAMSAGKPAAKSKSKPKTASPIKKKDLDADDGEEMKSGSLTIDDCRRFGDALEASSGRKRKAGRMYKLCWLLQCITGRRGMDVRSLQLKDIKTTSIRIGNSKLAETKGGRGKLTDVPIEPTKVTRAFIDAMLLELKRDGKRPSDAIFDFQYEATEMKTREVRATFVPRDKLSCPPQIITSHTPRRSLAGHLWRNGVSTSTIRKITGHASAETLTRYINNDYSFRVEAASKVKM
eukprot:g1758.t1